MSQTTAAPTTTEQAEFVVSVVEFSQTVPVKDRRLAEAFRRTIENTDDLLLSARKLPGEWRRYFEHFKVKPAAMPWLAWVKGL